MCDSKRTLDDILNYFVDSPMKVNSIDLWTHKIISFLSANERNTQTMLNLFRALAFSLLQKTWSEY